jgi:cleavage stimulation factor subunit 2
LKSNPAASVIPLSQRKLHVLVLTILFPGVSEDVITQTLERVGQVNHFRLVYDKETGKPKGFGFAEYADADQAAAAVRNLNEYELMGRKLRVDYSNDGQKDDHQGGNAPSAQPPSLPSLPPVNGLPVGQLQGVAPALPDGTGLGTHLTAQDAISQTVATISPLQLLDAMQQMQDLCRTEPDKAIQLLKQAPQLTYAITQILILMKLTDQNTLASVIQQTAAQPAARPGPPPAQQPPQQPPYQQYAPPPQPYAAPTPPVGMPYQPPQPQPQPPPQAAPPPATDQNALIQQVLAMTREQIDALAPNDRQQIVILRQQLGVPVPGYG